MPDSDDEGLGRASSQREAAAAASRESTLTHPLTRVLDPLLLKVLACPAPDHGELTLGEPGDPNALSLTCGSCGRIYQVRDGIPVLLLDEARWEHQPTENAVP
jgi:uncharacterized protein YbaR (Trm112 family)